MGSNAQVALEKFARYFDVECRLVPVTKAGGYVMQPKDAMKFVDENTIGIFVILGSTYTGGFENVQEMSDLCQSSEVFMCGICADLMDGAQWTGMRRRLGLVFLFMVSANPRIDCIRVLTLSDS